MKLAVISDLHLGDSNSEMAFFDEKDQKFKVGDKYQEFVRCIKNKYPQGSLDYLVLLGDILDFSIASYKDAYAVGEFFFENLQKDNVAGEIIYLAGNHDFDLWHTLEYQVNVINKIKSNKDVEPFRMSVPGIIDDRKKSHIKGLTLHKVTRRKKMGGPKYAGLYLDHITDPATHFNFVYPNLYLITEEETVMMTHGQYFDLFWSLCGIWGLKIINGDLDIKDQNLLDLIELVALNFPLSQFNSSGLGQAGPLTEVIQKMEHELKEKDFGRLRTYLCRMEKELKMGVGFFNRILIWFAFRIINSKLFKALQNGQHPRYRENFPNDSKVAARIRNYFASTVYELDELKEWYSIEIPVPKKVIFGHTHTPIAWNSKRAPEISGIPQLKGENLLMFNTGGWLTNMDENHKKEFPGAEVFFYETGKGFSSERID